MSRQSPAVARIVAVLNFFVEHPQQAFTLTQIVKSLKLSRATTHAILLGFVEAGYLYRRPDKSYILGPILPKLAASALEHFSPLAVANQELRSLADEFDVIASALFIEGDEMFVRDRAASVNHLGFARGASGRGYSIFPWGSIFLMGLSERELDARMDAAQPPLSNRLREDVLRGVTFAREYGFIASLGEDAETVFDFDAPSRCLSRLDADTQYQPHFVIAPVLSDDRTPAFAVSLFGFRTGLSGEEVMRCGRQLRESCDRISSFISGRRPTSSRTA